MARIKPEVIQICGIQHERRDTGSLQLVRRCIHLFGGGGHFNAVFFKHRFVVHHRLEAVGSFKHEAVALAVIGGKLRCLHLGLPCAVVQRQEMLFRVHLRIQLRELVHDQVRCLARVDFHLQQVIELVIRNDLEVDHDVLFFLQLFHHGLQTSVVAGLLHHAGDLHALFVLNRRGRFTGYGAARRAALRATRRAAGAGSQHTGGQCASH